MPEIKIEPEASSIAFKPVPKLEPNPPERIIRLVFGAFYFASSLINVRVSRHPLRGSPPLNSRILTMRIQESVQSRRHLHIPSPKAWRASTELLSSCAAKTRSRNCQGRRRGPKSHAKRKRKLPPQIPMQRKSRSMIDIDIDDSK